jgi:hypothetical protein
VAKGEMNDQKSHTVGDIRRRLTEIWNDLTFKDVQSVFLEWKIKLHWVIGNGAAYYSE